MKRLLSIIAIAVMAIVSASAVPQMVASIGGTPYYNIHEAVEALTNGDVLTLEADIELDGGEGALEFTSDDLYCSLDLNGHSIKRYACPIIIRGNVELYIFGNGLVQCEYEDAIQIFGGATCFIDNGTFVAAESYGIFLSGESYAEIKGGYFKCSFAWAIDQEPGFEGSELAIFGGYFSEEVSEDYLGNDEVTFCDPNEDPETKDEYPYVVSTAVASINGGDVYFDFPSAIANMKDGDVLVLESNVTMDDGINFENLATGEYIIDLNGHWVVSNSVDGTLLIDSEEEISVTVIDTKGKGYLKNLNPEGCVVFVCNGGFYAEGGSYYAADGTPIIPVNDGSYAEIYGGTFVGSTLFDPENADCVIYAGMFSMEIDAEWLGEGSTMKAGSNHWVLITDSENAIKPVLFNNKSKAVKTYENGHIVIIKENGAKYDLAGRRLK